ncbi:MAG: NB-ARC domain-containing protein [Xenococcaceae cyanobacterium]
MSVEKALLLVDRLIYTQTTKHLSDLQSTILRQVWQGKKYLEIADEYGCTEGHAKDVGSLLWKLLSKTLGEKVTKNNFRTVIERKLHLESSLPQPEIRLSPSKNFLGRQNAIEHLQTIVTQGNKIIVIQGEGGIGKTTLAQNFLHNQNFELQLEVLMAKETNNITSVESIVEEWLKQDLQEEPGKEFGVTLKRLKRQLENRRIGILIDNLEPALDKDGKFIPSQRNYVELLRILADRKVQSVTIITSRDRLCESDLDLEHYRLPGLDLNTWLQFFSLNQLPTIPKIIQKMHHTYGGNAKAMGILCGVIRQDFDGDINTYWQENGNDPLIEIDLHNLVTNQFNRLRTLDPEAYLLLCRLSCYRYQDVPRLPRSGLLALLWDIENSKRKRIINSLRHRSLVEFDRGKYWLHPVIKAAALWHLKNSDFSSINIKYLTKHSYSPWQEVHLHIAKFFTENVKKINNIQDGLTALEAYHHYVAIGDFAAAGNVILYSRDNQWGQFLTLGTTLYRLGLLYPVLKAITQIIDRIEADEPRSELNNILGDLYWITGKVHKAIACQQQTITIATKCLQTSLSRENERTHYYLKMLLVDSLLSIGLYHIDLWKLTTASTYFQQVIEFSQNTKHRRWAEKAAIGLALVNSYLNLNSAAYKTAEKFYQLIVKAEDSEYNTGRFVYFIQLVGQIYLNLGELAKAKTIFNRAIAFSQESQYTQIQAKSFTGIAIIYRQENNFEQANKFHEYAINLLEQIGAKCDLAEAYFQWGLTVQKLSQQEKSKKYFERAIKLFQEIDAPKQIEKISNYLTSIALKEANLRAFSS